MPEMVARIEQARGSGVDVGADTYAYPAWFNTFSAIIPPWAHDGGDAKLIERLKDPAMRARIRKEMETPGGDWENEWQEVPGPESILIGAVQNPETAAAAGQDHRGNREAVEQRSRSTRVFDLLIEDQAFTERGSVRHVGAGCHAGAAAAVGLDLQRFAGHGAGRAAGPGASASARVRHVSAHPAQVRARGDTS